MSLKEPIVEGAYYEREDGVIATAKKGPLVSTCTVAGHVVYHDKGTSFAIGGPNLTRRVYIVHTDPTSVAAALRKLSGVEDLVTELRETEGDNALYTRGTRDAYAEAADLVEEAMLTAQPKPPESA